MDSPDALDYDRAADRIGRILAAVAALGVVLAVALRGWQWGGGFFLGTLVAGLNYRWLRRLVEALGGERPKVPRRWFLTARYLVLGGAAYVIVRCSSVSLVSVIAGVFTLIAAVMIEAAIEIVYARK